MNVKFTQVFALLLISNFILPSLNSQTLSLQLNAVAPNTKPFSAGEPFTVTGTISGALSKDDDFEISVTCTGCGGVPSICTIIDLPAGGSGSCTTPQLTAPTGDFYGFLVTGSCNVRNPPGNDNFLTCISANILPVELGTFGVTYANNQVELKWQTLTELNNDRFEVEHSWDGYQFEKVGTVKGSGTLTEAKSYFYYHRMAVNGTHYYRLKQVDTDGTFDYSNVVSVIIDNGTQLSIYPNPAKDMIYIQYGENQAPASFQLMDALGRRIGIATNGNAGLYEMNLPAGLAKGTYWLKVERGGKVQTVPVVKE